MIPTRSYEQVVSEARNNLNCFIDTLHCTNKGLTLDETFIADVLKCDIRRLRETRTQSSRFCCNSYTSKSFLHTMTQEAHNAGILLHEGIALDTDRFGGIGWFNVGKQIVHPGKPICSFPLSLSIKPSCKRSTLRIRGSFDFSCRLARLICSENFTRLSTYRSYLQSSCPEYATLNLDKSPAIRNGPYLSKKELSSSGGLNFLNRIQFAVEKKMGYFSKSTSLDTRKWAFSTALGRKFSTYIIPYADFFNHCSTPNAHSTMPASTGTRVVDVIENYMNGVPLSRLSESYMHTYALRKILPREMIEIAYSDMDPLETSNTLYPSRASGHDLWLLQWGFLPPERTRYSMDQLDQATSTMSQLRMMRFNF